MRHLTISERVCGEERVIQEINFSKLIMVTDDSVGFIGIKNQKELLRMLDAMLENLAMSLVGVDEDSHDRQDLLDAILLQGILAINMATLALGPASEYDEFKKESGKLFDITSRLMGIGRDMANLSPNMHVMTEDELREAIGRQLMDELDEIDKRDQKEEG